jgi:hypothetical protein
MVAKLKCNLCERTLVKHCDHCAWWSCTNRECDAHRYDLDRGILLHASGTVEQLGATG